MSSASQPAQTHDAHRPVSRKLRQPRSRLTAEERYNQLLDAAAATIAEGGLDALSMEALAARVGASKTIGYIYFENIDSVAWSLYERESRDLFAAMRHRETAESFEAKIRRLVHLYLDAATRPGSVLAALLAAVSNGRVKPRASGEAQDFIRYLTKLLHEELQLDSVQAQLHARLVSMIAATHALVALTGTVDLAVAKEDCVAFIVGGLAAITTNTRSGAVLQTEL